MMIFNNKNHPRLFRRRKRNLSCFAAWILCLSIITALFSGPAFAAGWPTAEVTAEAAIVMDADTGAVLFSKNPRERMYPASITKLMTALVVLKYAKLDDKVTFSHDAVYNVDKGSSNAQIEEGDVLTVEDCLYALLLKSANEAANALAEHISGSREAFAELMTQEAAALGCTDTHFVNPSGLPSEEHYTTARDMAIMGMAAFQNEDFLRIDGSTSYKLENLKRVPDGLTIYMEHKMMLPNSKYYDSRVVGGKTGYTLDAGNTLITLAVDNGRRLVSVVLKDKNPAHYLDTKTMLDIAYNETENIKISDSFFDLEGIRERLIADTIVTEECKTSDLHIKGDAVASVPLGTQESELSYKLEYNLEASAPSQAVAEIQYLLADQVVGRNYLEKEPSIKVLIEDAPTTTKVAVAAISISGFTILAAVLFVLFGGGAAIQVKNIHDDKKRSRRMKERRRQRLEEMNITEEEFREMVDKKRQK